MVAVPVSVAVSVAVSVPVAVGCVGRVPEGVGVGDVVGYLGLDVEAGEGGGEVLGGFKGGGADVDGLVEDIGLETGGGGEEEAGLGGGAGA